MKPRVWLAPIPRAPPVTMTVRLSKRLITFFFPIGFRKALADLLVAVLDSDGPRHDYDLRLLRSC